MIYLFQCSSCGETRKENLKISDRDSEVNCECGSVMSRVFDSDMNFSLKGWGWTGRDYKEKRIREQRSVDMAIKQNERYGGKNKLIPNYKGHEADSWEQVRDQAVAEKGLTVASQYTDLVHQEKEGPKTRNQIVTETIRDMKG
jgi:putative FmdB family regulatory protein